MDRPPAPALRSRVASHLPMAFLGLLLVLSCNPADVVTHREARLVEVVPGGNVASGDLECWVTIEFLRYPEQADARDVRMRFYSAALTRPAVFDWRFIASNDVLGPGAERKSGDLAARETTPDEAPPLGEPLTVRFPLSAKSSIDGAPSSLWLQAELYWGGEVQDSVRHTIEHVYARTESGAL